MSRASAAGSSRRKLLEAAATAVAATGTATLVGCGSKSLHARVKKVGDVPESDIAILNSLLDLEHLTIAAYTAGMPLLDPASAAAAKRFLGQELAHAGELSGLVKDAHGKAHDPSPSYDLGHPRDSVEVLRLLHDVERRQLAAYLDAIPRLSGGKVRAAAGAILSSDAQHVSILRSRLGRSALPAAFLTGRE